MEEWKFQELADLHVVVDVPQSAEAQMQSEGFERCGIDGVWVKWLGESDQIRVTFELVNTQDLPKLPWPLVPIGVCSETNTVLLKRVKHN